jgi:AcrR family transcriptional regulator
MPRKRTISDDVLLDNALTLIREQGPEALTFSLLSSRAGLAASTIVQRFATKPELLRAALLHAWDRLEVDTAAADRAAPVTAEGAIDFLVRLSGQYDPHHYADRLLLRDACEIPYCVPAVAPGSPRSRMQSIGDSPMHPEDPRVSATSWSPSGRAV